ncbi:MAG TPA: RNase H-like domain-containing protein, partial [Candidatus Dojkabacteria bacterium]|nr:RNase H-like domain-containing protein [Candidatus Dojkabacteria bacterium]
RSVYSTSFEEHLKDLAHVLERVISVSLKLKISKCEFFMTELAFLGHKISSNGISPDPTKIEAIQKIPEVLNKDETMTFLGLTGYYRKFIHKYAEIAQPLHEIIHEEEWKWNEIHSKAVQQLKSALISAPVLAYPNPTKEFQVITDSSGNSIGGAIEQDGHPVVFHSESLKSYMDTDRKRNLCIGANGKEIQTLAAWEALHCNNRSFSNSMASEQT